jgi:hypothetical protein
MMTACAQAGFRECSKAAATARKENNLARSRLRELDATCNTPRSESDMFERSTKQFLTQQVCFALSIKLRTCRRESVPAN